MKKYIGYVLLFISALIFGLTFVVQKAVAEDISPFFFNALRGVVGMISLLPILYVVKRKEKKPLFTKVTLISGAIFGLVMFAGYTFLQYGVQHTTSGNSGFITSLNLIFVPLLGIFFHQKVKKIVYVVLPFTLLGVYLLCVKDGFSINFGDLLCLGTALMFAIQIVGVSAVASRVHPIALTFVQFVVIATCSFIATAVTQGFSMVAIEKSWWAILYAGIFVCGIAFTFQMIAQKTVPPSATAILLSLQSLFSLLFSVIFLDERMGLWQYVGAFCILASVMMIQIPWESIRKKGDEKQEV